jgi:hypothetical protein
MDALVPPDVSAELTQILSNLVLGDNEIRSKSVFSPTLFVDERLAHRPDVYLLALTQFATTADTVEVVCHTLPSMPMFSILILVPS